MSPFTPHAVTYGPPFLSPSAPSLAATFSPLLAVAINPPHAVTYEPSLAVAFKLPLCCRLHAPHDVLLPPPLLSPMGALPVSQSLAEKG